VRGLFVDFSKAFGCVDYTIVISTLIEFGIHGSVVKWFASFLINGQQHVQIGNFFSSWLTINGIISAGFGLGLTCLLC